jgi:hypothetical protein
MVTMSKLSATKSTKANTAFSYSYQQLILLASPLSRKILFGNLLDKT